jgi:hypothetical protein
MRLDTFRNYHHELIKLVNEIAVSLEPQQLDPFKMDLLITALNAKLNTYFEILFPECLMSANPKIRRFAESHIEQVNKIAQITRTYCLHWNNYLAIKNNPYQFCRETCELLSIIKAKVALEITKLYPVMRSK